MKICVYGAASEVIDKSFIVAGEELGREMARRGHSLVFGGGDDGMMGAVARGMYECGGYICGIAPSFFNVDGVLFEHCNEMLRPATMRERKKMLDEMSQAFIVTPGGIGTYEEFYEILSSKQLGRHGKAIAILNVNGYYDKLLDMMKHTAEQKFMKDAVFELYSVFTDVKELLDFIENYEEKIVNPSFTRHIKEMIEE